MCLKRRGRKSDHMGYYKEGFHKRGTFIGMESTYLPSTIVEFGHQYAVVFVGGDEQQVFDSLCVLVVGGEVPEDDTVLHLVWFTEGIDKCVGEVAPLGGRRDGSGLMVRLS